MQFVRSIHGGNLALDCLTERDIDIPKNAILQEIGY